MPETTKPAPTPAPTPETVHVKALDTKGKHEWVHRGKTMAPGDTAEVTLDQANRLAKAGLVTLVK